MIKEAPGKCPICGQDTEVTTIYCNDCGTKIEGHFHLCRFCRLTEEQKLFIETFVKCRGNIKEVEKRLGISYPTVRNRLEDAVNALSFGQYDGVQEDQMSERRTEILELLDKGTISVEDALNMLKCEP
jgi:hypothetical protein